MTDIAGLSTEQLNELVNELPEGDPERTLYEEILKQRLKERPPAAKKTTTRQPATAKRTSKGRKLRAAAPGDRAMRAADTFNSEPVKVEVWKEALAEATDPVTGEITLTGRIVQLGINAYFAQRKLDKITASATPTAPAAAEEDSDDETQPNDVYGDPVGEMDAFIDTPTEQTVEEQPAPTTDESQGEAPFVSISDLPGGLSGIGSPEGLLLTDMVLSDIFGDEVWDD